MIELNGEYNIKEQCELLSLNRTGIYYKKRPISAEKLAIMHCIDEIYTEFPYYGSRRMRAQLNNQGFSISRPTVEERVAVNASIQGSAGDITTSAQRRIDQNDRLKKIGFILLIQIHDELVFECPEQHLEESMEIIKSLMSHPFGDDIEFIFYGRMGIESDSNFIEPRTRRIFDNGSFMHTRMQGYMSAAGIILLCAFRRGNTPRSHVTLRFHRTLT